MPAILDLYQHYQQSTGVTTDTRLIQEGSIFFALKGENFDGNKYAGEALQKGACMAVVDDPSLEGTAFFHVDDALKALQDLAALHRKTLNIPVIGLTGTNGKTSTKELIREVLAKKYKVHATQGNLNNHIGVPLTVLGICGDTEIAVIEMGANHIGEIAELCTIARPTHGMITNIGIAHIEGFGSYEGVIKAKSELYDHLLEVAGIAFVNNDNSLLTELSSTLSKVTYGTSQKADIYGNINSSVPFLEIGWDGMELKTHFYGDYNFENIMAAICIGKYFELDPVQIADAITSYIPDNNRSQVLNSTSNTIFLDAYNANPSSMLASIRQFEKQEAEKKVLILGDMLELGKTSQEEHRKIISEIENKFETVILVGPEFMTASNISTAFIDTEMAASWLMEHPVHDAHILIKGSRGIALESLTELL